jgi:WD40 repeat protein
MSIYFSRLSIISPLRLFTFHRFVNVPAHPVAVNVARFTPYGRFLLIGDARGVVTVWSLDKAEAIRTMEGHADGIVTMAFHPSRPEVYIVGADAMISRWTWEDGNRVTPTLRTPHALRALAFMGDGYRLAGASCDGDVLVWETDEHSLICHVAPDPTWRQRGLVPSSAGWSDPTRAHTGGLHAVVFSPNALLMATAAADGTVKLWNASALRKSRAALTASLARSPHVPFHALPAALEGEEAPIQLGHEAVLLFTFRHEATCVRAEFSPDSMYLITASNDCTVRVFHAETGVPAFHVNLPVRLVPCLL